jgi:hypothetical protein
LEFEARGGRVKLTVAACRDRVFPYLQHPEARAALLSILERADEARTWDLAIPDALDAQEELVSQVVRAGGPAVSSSGRSIRMYTVVVRSDETHEEEAARYWSDSQPKIGQKIEAGGMALEVENVLQGPKSVMLECARVSEPV